MYTFFKWNTPTMTLSKEVMISLQKSYRLLFICPRVNINKYFKYLPVFVVFRPTIKYLTA